MAYKAVKGMLDILPNEIGAWQQIERIARNMLEAYGFKEIRTPILEETGVFTRSIGETSDIVTKEMYTLIDRGDRSLTLRPEGTAPIVRSYIENSLDKRFSDSEVRLYYLGPMFRAERPQKGRFRQFHQIGAEIIGSRDIQFDFELIMQLDRMLKEFGLKEFKFKINSLGCSKDKEVFSKKLHDYLKDEAARLCDDCKARLEKNVLRVLDCKNESCKTVLRSAPGVRESLCGDCASNFTTFEAMLKSDGISFEVAPNLVRGLDYYTGIVFEIIHPGLGSQDAIGAGGRYDNLVKDMGGPDVGAVGYAIGVERVMLALGDGIKLSEPKTVFFAALDKNARIKAYRLAEDLRKDCNDSFRLNVIALTGGAGGASLKSQMRNADRHGAKVVVIIGEDELKKGEAVLRNMTTKEQISVKFEDTVKQVKNMTMEK